MRHFGSEKGAPAATTTVLIDDAVLGRLPRVCGKDGVSTDDRRTINNDVGAGRLGPAPIRLLALGLAVLTGLSLIRVIIDSVRIGRASVGMDLDASHRWVVLCGVHPDFVTAVERAGHDTQTAPPR